ncbi:hypothetical protein IF799_17810, partial [Citrobacter freundii]|nr:hypothetical protein [Citrobacter freundii]
AAIIVTRVSDSGDIATDVRSHLLASPPVASCRVCCLCMLCCLYRLSPKFSPTYLTPI